LTQNLNWGGPAGEGVSSSEKGNVPVLMDFDHLRAAVGGRFLGGNAGDGFSSVHIDSRKVKPGALFVALKGRARDGHCYIEAAFKSGAVCALVEASKLEELGLEEKARRCGGNLVVVENTLRALQDAAAAYLDTFPNLVLGGLTGSSGKTTTREIAATIAGREMPVAVNPMNLNSETGLPLAVFEVRDYHRMGIFEIGMDRPGEIAELARVLRPHAALITNVGISHIGKIGSRRGIAFEKKQIFSCLKEKDIALIPASSEFRQFLAEGLRGIVRFYGPEKFEELGSIRDLGLQGSEITWAGEKVRFGLPGRHNLADAVAAIALVRELGIGDRAIREGLESVRPLFGRSEILPGTMTLIRDCYNANPESAAAAINFCDALEYPGRKIYVLGSMLELGEDSPAAHRDLGSALARSTADRVFLYGREMEDAAAELEKTAAAGFFHTNSMEELASSLKNYVKPGDLILLKGSRGCALERLTPVFTGGREGEELCS
jgi:UDP-N-acetylmuramoyl-tripeptide--D-alanyl-D-alanine ligase